MEATLLESAGEAAESMQESWVDVQQGRPRGGTGGGGGRGGGGGGGGEGRKEEEETLVHSRSQQEMEQLLASAVSGDEAPETEVSFPSFSVPEHPVDPSMQQGSVTGLKYAHQQRQRSGSYLRLLSLRGSWLFSGSSVFHLLFPVLVLTHLALFGIGFYIGRRTTLVKAL